MSAALPSVLTALSSTWDGPVVAAVDASRELTIARRCADLADLLATAASGLGQVALVSGHLRGLTLSTVTTLRDSGVEVVGLAEPGDDEGEMRLWQLGVHSVVSVSAPATELVSTLVAAAREGGQRSGGAARDLPASPASAGGIPDGSGSDDALAAAPGPGDDLPMPATSWPVPVRETPGKVLVVWGPTGSPGRTSVAVNLAVELVLLGRQVLLVDADTYGGCVAQTLALLDEAPGIAAAARSADHGALDVGSLSRLALEVRPGLRVLTGIGKAERWPEIRGAALERVLRVCRGLADVVVVDVGFALEDDEELSYDTQAPRRNQATLTALQEADLALAVGGCDPVSLQRLVRGLQELGTVRAPVPLVVINRLRDGAVGSPAAPRVADALARFAGVSDVHTIPDDPAAFDAALFAGRALAEIVPTSPARRAIAELAAGLAGQLPADVPPGRVARGAERRLAEAAARRRAGRPGGGVWGRRRR